MVSLKNLQIFSEAEVFIPNLSPFDFSKLIVSRINRGGYHSASFDITYFSESMERNSNTLTQPSDLPLKRSSKTSYLTFDSLVARELHKRGTLSPQTSTGATHSMPWVIAYSLRKRVYA